jgi:choline dehydrogenase-like flavoprotein
VASHVVMKDGKAAGIAYIDRMTREPREVMAKTVVLCASTLESTRLMLNSGICNSSGVLGHYVMDHIYGGGAAGEMPMLESRPWAGPPRRPNGIYIPRFRNVTESNTNGFIRGYGYQGTSSPAFEFGAAGFGAKYKDEVRKGHWGINLTAFGECLARKENYVDIDPDRVDAWGIPVLRTNVAYGDNEMKVWQDGREQAAAMLEAAGAKNVHLTGERSTPGFCIHEIGTARMGADPKTSVVNPYCQSHDVKNLFVTDGACWVSSGCQNPTLTMMAITVRACEYIIHEHAKKRA